MAFGWPTRYIQLDMTSVGGPEVWDRAIYEANAEYKGRVVSSSSGGLHCLVEHCSFALFFFVVLA